MEQGKGDERGLGDKEAMRYKNREEQLTFRIKLQNMDIRIRVRGHKIEILPIRQEIRSQHFDM